MWLDWSSTPGPQSRNSGTGHESTVSTPALGTPCPYPRPHLCEERGMGSGHRRQGPGELHFPRVLGQERFPRRPRRAAEETTPRGEEHVDLPLHPWALPLLWRVEGARLLRPPPPRSAVPPLNPIQAHLRARTGKGSNRFRTAGGGTPVHDEVDPPSANPPPPSSPPEDWGRGREPEEVVGARCSEVSCLNPLAKGGGRGAEPDHALAPP